MDKRNLSSHWQQYLPLNTAYEPLEEPLWAYPFKAVERIFYPPVHWNVWQTVKSLFLRPSHGTWRAAKVLSILRSHFADYDLAPHRFVIIGDGAGALAILIRKFFPQSTLYLIDFETLLRVQAKNLERYGAASTLNLFVGPDDLEAITGTIDCAINVASMGEMTDWAIARYFRFLCERSGPQSRFLCVNRVEKRLCGGEIVRFQDYPWNSNDTVFLDERWPIDWFLDWRPPFYHRFHGAMWCRLTHLAPK